MRKLKLLLVLCLVAIAASAGKTVYFNPGAWDADGAQYAAWAWETDKAGNWYAMTDTNDDGIFEYTFDDAIGNLIFARISSLSNTTAFEGADIVYKTSDINRCEDGLLYVNRGSGNSPQIAICALNPSAGDDMTSFVTNPNFASSADGWTIEGQARLYNGTGFDGDKFIELTNWGSSWDATISQSINGLPNGYYVVKAASQMSGASEIWMKLVANGAESRFSRNGDTNGNILSNGTETTLGGNGAVAGWRYTSVIVKVSDGTLAISCVGHSDVKERWANFDHVTLTYLGAEIAPNTDVTDFINNWDFWGCFNGAANFNGWTAEAPNGGNVQKLGDSDVEYWIGTAADGAFDYYQTVTGLPEGRYEISGSMFNTQAGEANGNAGVYGTSNDVTAFAGVTIDSDNNNHHTYSTSIFVNNGELRLGVKNNGTMGARWFGVDWIKLNYVGKVVQDYAMALPDGGAMAADTWYYFDIAAAADNYEATATTLGNIICVSDANALITSAGTVTLTAKNNSLAVGRYYVKSSSANNLVVEVSAYTYTISEATANVSYIQPDNTVTVSYTVSTNDPGAVLSQDYSDVTFNGNAISVTPTASGFTFTVPSLAANSEYTLAIPVGAIGYADGSTYNAAQNITLKTPAVYDGTYFFKVENDGALNGQYLSRGKNWGTHATIDKYGLAIKVATDGQNKTTLKPFDTDRFYRMDNTANNYWDCWADNTTNDDNAKFNLVANNGHISIHPCKNPDAEDYFKYNEGDVAETTIIWADSHSGGSESTVHVLEFSLESAASHATAMQALKDSQAATAAAAAYASGNYTSLEGITTVAALEAELTTNYIQGDFVAPTAIESVLEKYQGDQPNPSPETVYSNTINITEPGFYKFSMQAFYRAGDNARTQAMHTAGVDYNPVVLFFGDNQTQIKSLYDEAGRAEAVVAAGKWGADSEYNGKFYPNCMDGALQYFKEDMFHNDVWLYVSAAGEYTYGVKYLGFANANAQWFIYSPQSVTITSYAAAADATDYANLATAIEAYDNATWGFEKDEYAPYNNLEAMANITAAKDINSEGINSKLLVNSLIDEIALVANAEEVNAFADPTFAKSGNDAAQLGWITDHSAGLGGATHARAFVLESGETNYDNLAAFGQGDGTRSASYFRFDGTNSSKTTVYTYGTTNGYTVPLKAAYYNLTAQIGGWGQVDKDVIIQVVNSNDEVVGTQTIHTPNTGVNAGGSVVDVDLVFQTGAAGNYRVQLKNGSTGADNAVVISNLNLRRYSPVYAIVGNNTEIFSDAWDQGTSEDILSKESAGVWSKTYTNLELDKQTIAYKIIKKQYVESASAAAWYSNKGEANSEISIPVKGIYNITFTFTESGSVVSGVATKTAEAVYIGNKGWATTVTNSALDFSAQSDVEAYTAAVEGNVVKLADVLNVQDETGLVLKGDSGTYYIPVIASSETDKGSLMFSSTLTYDTWGDNTFYGLTVNDKNEAQFAQIDRSKDEVTIPAGKAFLMIPGSGARVLTVVFDDETTGIRSIDNGQLDNIYDLQGRKVAQPTKGLYIVNGKKVVKK